MKWLAAGKSNLATTAGPRLRCFLGRVVVAFMASLAISVTAGAQLDIPGPFRVSHLRGVIVSPYGKPVENAKVTLVRDGKVVEASRTDATGRFDFEHASGRYQFLVKTPLYSIVSRDVIVEFEVVTALSRNELYIILGPGACSDDCSTVFTSKGKFEKAVRRIAGRNDRK